MALVESLPKPLLDATNRFARDLESARRLPIYEYHKWWARRYSGVIRLFLAYSHMRDGEIDPSEPAVTVKNIFNDYSIGENKTLVDLFGGGGTIVFEGTKLGYDAHGVELNSVAYWILNAAEQFEYIEPFQEELVEVIDSLSPWWTTKCDECGGDAQIVHTFLSWKDSSGEMQIKLNEIKRSRDGDSASFYCPGCDEVLKASSDIDTCPSCSQQFGEELGEVEYGAIEPYAEEYYCRSCDYRDVRNLSDANENQFTKAQSSNELDVGLPAIPKLNETKRLLSKGFGTFDELFTDRQIHTFLRILRRFENTKFNQLAKITVSDSLRSCSYLAQYNPKYRKITPGFAVKSYWLPTQPVELNPLSHRFTNDGVLFPVGRGNIISAYRRLYRAEKFAEKKNYNFNRLSVYKGAVQSRLQDLPDDVDIIFTDPPYADFQYYSDLSLLNQAVVCNNDDFHDQVQKLKNEELIVRQKGDYEEYLEQLRKIFSTAKQKITKGGYLLITYHHTDLEVITDVLRILRDGEMNLAAIYPVVGESSGRMGSGSKKLYLDLLFVLCNDEIGEIHTPKTDVCETEYDRELVNSIPRIVKQSNPT